MSESSKSELLNGEIGAVSQEWWQVWQKQWYHQQVASLTVLCEARSQTTRQVHNKMSGLRSRNHSTSQGQDLVRGQAQAQLQHCHSMSQAGTNLIPKQQWEASAKSSSSFCSEPQDQQRLLKYLFLTRDLALSAEGQTLGMGVGSYSRLWHCRPRDKGGFPCCLCYSVYCSCFCGKWVTAWVTDMTLFKSRF